MTTTTHQSERTAVDDFLAERIARVRAGERCEEVFDGRYTISNTKTKGHRTFKISTVRNPKSPIATKRVVALLTGSDNTTSYTGFAFLDEEGIHPWSNRRSAPWTVFAAMLWSLATDDDDAERWREKGAELLVEGRCLCCGRALTVPESIRLGIGPVCLAG